MLLFFSDFCWNFLSGSEGEDKMRNVNDVDIDSKGQLGLQTLNPFAQVS